jgi:hypothetical protein
MATKGPAEPTASSRPKAPPATQKKVSATSLVQFNARRGCGTKGSLLVEVGAGICLIERR